jgi:hypothetical protein
LSKKAELNNPELVERAPKVLRRYIRFVLLDLAPQLRSVILTVLEGVDQFLILASSELCSVKSPGPPHPSGCP